MNTTNNQQETDITPKLRFPEFQTMVGWECKPLGKLGLFLRGLTYSANDVVNDNNGLLVLRSSNIQDNNLILDKDLVYVKKNCQEELLLKKGDIVICMSNGSKALVGKNAEYKGNYSKNLHLTVGAFCSIFRPDTNFCKYLFKTESYDRFVAFSIGGGNINNLKNSILEKYIVAIPQLPQEQH